MYWTLRSTVPWSELQSTFWGILYLVWPGAVFTVCCTLSLNILIYKCDRLDWTRPPRASMRKKRVTLSYLYYSTNHLLLDDVNQSFISWTLLKCLNRFVMLLETSHNAHSSLVWNWRCVTFSEWKQTAPRPQIVNCKLINSAIIPIMAQSIPLRDDTKNGCVAD